MKPVSRDDPMRAIEKMLSAPRSGDPAAIASQAGGITPQPVPQRIFPLAPNL